MDDQRRRTKQTTKIKRARILQRIHLRNAASPTFGTARARERGSENARDGERARERERGRERETHTTQKHVRTHACTDAGTHTHTHTHTYAHALHTHTHTHTHHTHTHTGRDFHTWSSLAGRQTGSGTPHLVRDRCALVI